MKLLFTKGTAYKLEGGLRVAVDSIEATDNITCCSIDCCNYVVTMPDKKLGTIMVGYFFNGVWTVTTKAQFDLDKAAGVFTY